MARPVHRRKDEPMSKSTRKPIKAPRRATQASTPNLELTHGETLSKSHLDGLHDARLMSGCPACRVTLNGASVTDADAEGVPIPPDPELSMRRMVVARVEERVTAHVEGIVRRLRDKAAEVERMGARLVEPRPWDGPLDLVHDAESIASTVAWLFPNLHAPDLIRLAVELRDARLALSAREAASKQAPERP
jgi:hypothetical protein